MRFLHCFSQYSLCTVSIVCFGSRIESMCHEYTSFFLCVCFFFFFFFLSLFFFPGTAFLPGPPFSRTAQNVAFFPLPPQNSFILLSLFVFTWNCGRGSRPWSTQSVRLDFSGVILCKPWRPGPRRCAPSRRLSSLLPTKKRMEKKENKGTQKGENKKNN